MKKTFTVTIKNKETGKVYQERVSSEDYILKEFEKKGFKLAFSCRNGCCTSCAVKIKSGTLQQPEASGCCKVPDLILTAQLVQQPFLHEKASLKPFFSNSLSM